MQSHIREVYVCLAVTCHLHFWQIDRDLLRATAVTWGLDGYRNKSQYRKLTLEKKILPPFLQGFEPVTFQSSTLTTELSPPHCRNWKQKCWGIHRVVSLPLACEIPITAEMWSNPRTDEGCAHTCNWRKQKGDAWRRVIPCEYCAYDSRESRTTRPISPPPSGWRSPSAGSSSSLSALARGATRGVKVRPEIGRERKCLS